MKKIAILATAITLSAFSAGAQGFYFRGGLGYAVPQAAQTMDGTGQIYNGSATPVNDTLTTYKIKKASFSSGVHGSFGFGYMFNQHVGVDLNMDIGLSPAKYTYNDNNVVVDSLPSNVAVTQHAKTPVILTPALVLQTGGEKLNLYTRIGIVIPISTKIVQDQIITNLPGAGAVVSYDYALEVTNNFGLGFSAACGVSYSLSEKMSIYGEAGFLSLSQFVKQSTLTGVIVSSGGQSQSYPPSAVSGTTTINYSNSFTGNPSNTGEQPTYSQPFSNFNFNVGVKINLGGHHKSYSSGTDDGGGFKRKSSHNF